MSTQTQILTSEQIADQCMAAIVNPQYLTPEALRGLLVIAARTGKLAGLLTAQKDMSAGWPQGQYDVFNEHQFAARLKKRITGVMRRLAG